MGKDQQPTVPWYFAVPVLATLGLIVWWLYALTHPIHFVGHQPRYSPNGNLVAFNILLTALVAGSWAGVIALFDWRRK